MVEISGILRAAPVEQLGLMQGIDDRDKFGLVEGLAGIVQAGMHGRQAAFAVQLPHDVECRFVQALPAAAGGVAQQVPATAAIAVTTNLDRVAQAHAARRHPRPHRVVLHHSGHGTRHHSHMRTRSTSA